MGKALLLSVKEAAAAIGVGERTVHKWILAEKIGHKIGQDGRKKIPLAQLKKQLEPETYEVIKFRLESGEDPTPVQKQPAKRPCQKAACKKGAKRAGH